VAVNTNNPFQIGVEEEPPKVTFDFNQNVLVFIEEQALTYLPCMSVSPEDMVSRIEHKSWIKYRGLARFNGTLYMRFIHKDAEVYVGLGFLPFLEDIPQRSPGHKQVIPKNRIRTVAAVKPRGLRQRRKPGIRKKKEN